MHNAYYQSFLDHQKLEHRLRSLSDNHEGINIDFSSNDYLGLSSSLILKKVAEDAACNLNVGATGSRLFSGNHKLYKILETQIAKDKDQEKALYFSTGFQANFSVLSALLDHRILEGKPVVFFDKRNHNSMYQAIFASKVELVRYQDITDLKQKLQKYSSNGRPKFLVTETVFGMDGDIIDLPAIKKLAIEYDLFLILDEAHATGILGSEGLGLSKTVDFENVPVLIMGTFSKALGLMGAYVASSGTVIDYLINKASGFIYSTATSPIIIACCIEAWKLNKEMDPERKHLQYLSLYLRKQLQNLKFIVTGDATPIISIVLGSETAALAMKDKLQKQGILVSCVRYPTVPINMARIRIALTASHTIDDVNALTKALV